MSTACKPRPTSLIPQTVSHCRSLRPPHSMHRLLSYGVAAPFALSLDGLLIRLCRAAMLLPNATAMLCLRCATLYVRGVLSSVRCLVQENPIEPPAGSRLPTVVDSLGNAVQRSTLLLRERTLLNEVQALSIIPHSLVWASKAKHCAKPLVFFRSEQLQSHQSFMYLCS